MKKKNSLILVVFLLAAILILLLMFAQSIGGENPSETTGSSQPSTDTTPSTQATQPSTEVTEPSTQPSTEVTQPSTEPSTEATQPSTEPSTSPAPSGSSDEMIGSLYTRGELEAMDTTYEGYGPGRTSGGKRAPYAESDQKKYGKYGANFIAPDNGNIYLTFDCGFEHYVKDENGNKIPNTARILDILKEKNAKGVFFVTMDFVKKEPALVQRMIDEGHTVGNHSNNHKRMSELPIDEMVYEVMSLHEYVLEHFGYVMNLFRPPEGNYSVQSLCVLQSLGYKTVHWSFAYGDYDEDNQPDVASSLDLVTRSHHSGAIYLLHAISETNAALLADAIDFFRAEGYNIELFR